MNQETLADRHERERTGVEGDPVPDREYGDEPEDVDHALTEIGESVSEYVPQRSGGEGS